jgi:chromate transporter
MDETKQVSYGELARVFLRLSATAFGGPVAHIALAEDEIVTRRKWLTRDHYLDLIAATNLIPGPNSTEVMIHVGYVLLGIPGAILTGACFIIPAFLITLALAVIYVSTGNIPQINALLWGIKPVIVAIIANAGYRLARTALHSPPLWVLFLVSVGAIALLIIPEVLVMLGAGALYALYKSPNILQGSTALMGMPVTLNLVGAFHETPLRKTTSFMMAYSPILQAIAGVQVSVWELFWYFLRIGSVLFGSGYILIAYIQSDLVNSFGWLSAQQLLDAIAIGQVTPGPVSTAAGVVGYILAGFPGAIAATAGIFLPSFVLVILTAPLIPRMRRSRIMSAFLSGINAGVIAAIGVTLVDLALVALRTPDGTVFSVIAIALCLATLVALVRFRVNATWLILLGGVVGLLFSFI